MSFFLANTHEAGCSPMARCRNCLIAAFLRSKLSEPEMTQLANIMAGFPYLSTSIDELEFSVRTSGVLKRLNVRTIGDLVMKTESQLLTDTNMGRKGLNEIKAALAEKGMHIAVAT